MRFVPVILVGGGLGAGKTSVLRALLAAPGVPRLGLVVNEFGDLDVDGAVLEGQGADAPVVKLPNGCVCCAAGGDLAAAISRLLRAESPPELVVVELSGVADPYPVLRELSLVDGAARLTNLVAVVDLDLPPSAAVADPALLRVLSRADTVILNKNDLVPEERVIAWTDVVRSSNPAVTVHATMYGRVPTEVLLAHRRDRTEEVPRERAAHRSYQSTSVTIPPGLTRARLQEAFEAPEWVERAKGFVELADGAFLFQVVRGRATFEALPTLPPALIANKVVVISSNGAALRQRVAALW